MQCYLLIPNLREGSIRLLGAKVLQIVQYNSALYIFLTIS